MGAVQAIDRQNEDRGLSLYQIEAELNEAVDLVMEGDETALAVIDSYIRAGREKVESIGRLIRSDELDEKSAKEEIARLQDFVKRKQGRQERVKKYLLDVMRRFDYSELRGRTFSFKRCKNPASVEILDEAQIPARFKTIIPESCTVSKDAVKRALKANEDVPGARLIDDRERVDLK